MAKRSSAGDSELNLDSLMDAVTNVVGVLMIVFVMMALNTARMVQKILSDLPPVTPEQHQEMQEQVKALPPPPADPKQLEEDKKKTEDALKKAIEQLKTVDTSELQSRIKFMDLDAFRKQLDDAKKVRDTQKVEVDKLLTELERLKALLDQTPVYQPPPPTFVRLPNPRPFPEKANETRIMVAKQGIMIVNDKSVLDPVISGLDKIKSQLEYKEVKIDHFAKILEKVFGSMAAAQQAWSELSALAGTFQMEHAAQAYKTLADAKLAPNRAMLQALGDISIVTRSNLPAVAAAVVAATQGDYSKWTALDPSRDPTKPTITATTAGDKVSLAWGSNKSEVKQNPRDVLNYFTKELADISSIKNRSRDKVIYDAFKIQQTLERAAASPTLNTGPFTIQPAVRPGSTAVQVALLPKAGAGETLDQMRNEGSNFQRQLRQVKGDPNGVAIFQVMPDAFATYLEARKIADEVGVAATWEFLARLDITMNVPGFEVQRFIPAPPPTPPGTAPGVRIAPPTRKLD